jgi:hypothetical protein
MVQCHRQAFKESNGALLVVQESSVDALVKEWHSGVPYINADDHTRHHR